MLCIRYTPLAVSSSGLGSLSFYNADGSHSDASVATLFNTSKSSFAIGSDVAYYAELVHVADRINLLAGNVQVIDSYQQSSYALNTYITASRISGATVVNGVVVTPGGAAKCVLTGVAPVNNHQHSAVGYCPGTAALSSITAGNLTLLPFACTLKNLYIQGDSSATTNNTLTIYKNGLATALTVTIPNLSNLGNDTTHTVDCVAGDSISLYGTAVVDFANVAVALEVDPT